MTKRPRSAPNWVPTPPFAPCATINGVGSHHRMSSRKQRKLPSQNYRNQRAQQLLGTIALNLLVVFSTHGRVHPVPVAEDEVHRHGRIYLGEPVLEGRVRPRPGLQHAAQRALPAAVGGRQVVVQVVTKRSPVNNQPTKAGSSDVAVLGCRHCRSVGRQQSTLIGELRRGTWGAVDRHRTGPGTRGFRASSQLACLRSDWLSRASAGEKGNGEGCRLFAFLAISCAK